MNHQKILDKLKSKLFDIPEKRTLKIKEFRARGCSHYLHNIQSLACINKDWKKKNDNIVSDGLASKKIYRYYYTNTPVNLIGEPTNPHDKNAIQVIVANKLIGYVPAEECLSVKNIFRKYEIKYISCFIGGGEFKVVSENLTAIKMEEQIYVNNKLPRSKLRGIHPSSA